MKYHLPVPELPQCAEVRLGQKEKRGRERLIFCTFQARGGGWGGGVPRGPGEPGVAWHSERAGWPDIRHQQPYGWPKQAAPDAEQGSVPRIHNLIY